MNLTIGPELADSASFIFSGSVTATDRTTVRILAGRPGLAVARLSHAFRVNPMLGDLAGQEITVQIPKGTQIAVGESAVFFANSWVHSEGIAVAALGVFPANERTEIETRDAIAGLPELYLRRRAASAVLIVQGEVEKVARAELRQPLSEHMATWMRAEIAVREVLKDALTSPSVDRVGHAVTVYFPASDYSKWARWPKLTDGQKAIFLLHRAVKPPVPADALVLPDPADVQPVSAKRKVRTLIDTGDSRS